MDSSILSHTQKTSHLRSNQFFSQSFCLTQILFGPQSNLVNATCIILRNQDSTEPPNIETNIVLAGKCLYVSDVRRANLHQRPPLNVLQNNSIPWSHRFQILTLPTLNRGTAHCFPQVIPDKPSNIACDS